MGHSRIGQVVRELRAGLSSDEAEPDAQLLERFVNCREEAAFATLLVRHGPMVLGVCRRILHNPQDAEDAFQATFLVLARKAAGLRRRELLGNWLYGVAYRTAQRMRATCARRLVKEREMARSEAVHEETPDELLPLLDRELSRLPEKYRMTVVLCDLEGKSYKEAAQLLGWPEGTLAGRLSRARALLARQLSRSGLVLSSGALTATLAQTALAATVPARLCDATVQAVLGTTAGVVSARVAALTAAMMKVLLVGRLRMPLTVLLLLLAVSVGLLAQSAPLPEKAQPPRPQLPVVKAEGQRQTPTDCYGDPLPPGAVARMGTVRFRTGNIVNSVAWAPGGKLLATAGDGRLIQLWDPTSGREVARLPALASRVNCLTFSPDGKWLAVTGDYSAIHLWDASRFGKQDKPRQLTCPESGSSLAFAPDNKTLYSCGYDGFIRAWDIATGRELRRFGPPLAGKGGPCFTGIALDPDASLLVTRNIAQDGDNRQTVATHLWNPRTGEHIRQLGKTERAHSFATSYAAVFSSDGRTVAAVNDDGMKLWNADTGAELAVLKVHAQRMAFAPDGNSLYGGHNGQLCRWAVPSGRVLRSFEGACRSDSPIALSPDGKTMAVGDRFSLALWDVTTGKRKHSWPGHDTELWSLLFINEGKELLTAGYGSPVHRWNLEGQPLGAWKQPANWVWTTAALSPDGKTLAVQNDELRALLVDPLTGKERQSFNNHQDRQWRQAAYFPMQFAFSPDSRRVLSAAGGVDRHVRLWEADTAREIWNVRTGKPDTLIQGFALSPDGQTMYLAGDGGPVKVYEVGKAPPAGQAQRQIGDAKAVIRSLCLSRDGRRLAGVDSNHLIIWDTATGAEVWRLPRPKVSELYNRRFLKFSPDGRMLAIWTGDEPTVRCLEIASGQVLLETTGHLEMVLSAEFSADGRYLATGGTDTTALLWDLRTLALAGHKARKVDLERLWSELAAPDARIAHRAVVQLQQLGPKAVSLLADRMKPDNPRPLAACLADLDDATFRVRERATEELMGRTGDRGELAKALAATRSVEVRRRLQRILDRLSDHDPGNDVRRLQSLRGLETLEGIGTPQARRIVETLARGAPEAELTREAAATLKRLR